MAGWFAPRISFSHYGERGMIDLLAWQPASRSLLVIELKTELVDIGELLGTLDKKVRNASNVARGLGWEVGTVSSLLVIGDSHLNRRRVHAHTATFAAALPHRFVAIRKWLAAPAGSARGLMFFANRHPRQHNERIAGVRRVRRVKPSRSAGESRMAAGRA